MKVVSPDKQCAEVDSAYGLGRYRPKNGVYDVHPADARLLVQYGGFLPSALGPPARRREGYRCTGCGFGSWFTTCSRCGEPCEREG